MGRALITGASGGIGLELARLFARDKHDLVVVARNADKLNQLKAELEREEGITVTVCIKDLAEVSAASALVEFLDREKIRIDYLINNAGFGDYGFFYCADWQKIERMIRVNILALTQLTRLLLPEMIRRKAGWIMNVASTAGFLPGPLMAVYYASKAYVVSFSQALANELKGTGVIISTLCPGPTPTGFQTMAGLPDAPMVKMKVLTSPAEVARIGYRSLLRGKTVAIPGLLNKFTPLTVRLLPVKMLTGIIRKISTNRNTG